MTTGQRIAQKRKEIGLSQEALGEEVGVSRQSIYKWESDAALPEIDKLVALSRRFGVTVGWLLGVEEAPEAPPAPDSWELTDAQVEKVINIDLIGTWRTDKYAAIYMRKQGFGRIINISSTSGMYGTPKLATYCMAKWGVRGLTKTLAQELKGTGIVVNSVCPTKVKTPMCETDSYVQFINDLTGKNFKSWQEMYEGVPFLDVEDISDMVFWLGTSRSAGKFSGRDLGLDLGTLQQ